MEGGPSKGRKYGRSFLKSNDKCKINVSLSLSNSALESKPSSPEYSESDNPNQQLMDNSLEIPPAASSTSTSMSSINSTVTVEGSRRRRSLSSSGISGGDQTGGVDVADSNMMLVGCPRCLMYVMLWKQNPRCPRCNNSTLLNIFSGH